MPSAAASRSSGSSRKSARTRCQCCIAASKSVRPTHSAARRCQRAAAERLARLLPVMRQQRGALVELLGVLPLDRARHRGVHLAPPLPQLASRARPPASADA